MSNKSPQISTSPSIHASKLPKFLQKSSRDRSKSMVDPGSSSVASSSSSSSPLSDSPKSNHARKSSKKGFGFRDRDRDDRRRPSQDVDPEHPAEDDSEKQLQHQQHQQQQQQQQQHPDEPPVIVEPSNFPRARTRSERPLSDNYSSPQFYSSPSSSRLSDLPNRLSGWFSHTFSSSTTDLALPNLLSQQHLSSASPKGKASALLTAARHGRGHLDKAMRYLLDSDATPDKCPDPIWLLGLEHPGYDPTSVLSASTTVVPVTLGRRSSAESRRSPSSFNSSSSSSPGHHNTTVPGPDLSLSQSQPPSSSSAVAAQNKDPSKFWPPVFYADFTSRIWLTYRSQFSPIRDTSLIALEADLAENHGTPSSPQPKKWNWPLGGEKVWTSDSGWGCMLRTGQSLLANTLLHLHLGRDWRRPPYPIYTADYATYVQIITWFLDHPSALCPFSVHRMALVGKELGKEVGQWFGPSTAAGAIKTLVNAFPAAGLGVAVAADGVVYQSDVFAASRSALGSPTRHSRSSWGDRAVLILIGIRLGLDGVNPIYYETIKTFYTFPQSVGIAGGRPSSSYYFVGSQADNLFYLDPHHARPTVQLRIPPGITEASLITTNGRQMSTETSSTTERERPQRSYHTRSPTSPISIRSNAGSGSSAFSHRSPVAPSPLQQQLSTDSASTSNSSSSHPRWRSSSGVPDDSEMDSRELELGVDLDPLQRHYVTAYSATELKTFHCDRVRKMPLSGLDPSMLIGFLCKDENDWHDLRSRMNELNRTHKTIFSIQDEPPNWPSDSDDSMGLESISEPDDVDMPEDDELSDNQSPSESPAGSEAQGGGSKSEVDTEEDPIDPITPGAGKSSFDMVERPKMDSTDDHAATFDDDEEEEEDDDDDEEWLDSLDTPQMPSEGPLEPSPEATPSTRLRAPPMAQSRSTSSTASRKTTASTESGKARKKSKKSKGATTDSRPSPAPAEQVQYPFPATQSVEDVQLDTERSKRIPQMRTAKARDGGRTQSGGVRGVPTDDLDDFS